jgi:hypothetical protein
MSRDSALSDYDNVNILLLTDGDPSPLTVPPSGIASALRDLMCELPSRDSITAFGYGYQMKSDLLLQIAQAGNGAFAFIPDASMVGTVFCHAVSNALVAVADPLNRNVILVSNRMGENFTTGLTSTTYTLLDRTPATEDFTTANFEDNRRAFVNNNIYLPGLLVSINENICKGTNLAIRSDHGTQYDSADFVNEMKFIGLTESKSFVRSPELS